MPTWGDEMAQAAPTLLAKRRHPLLTARFMISSALIVAVTLLAVFGPSWYPISPVATVGRAERPPSQEHPLGTDARGRDVLAQIVHGTRTSLFIGLLAAS